MYKGGAMMLKHIGTLDIFFVVALSKLEGAPPATPQVGHSLIHNNTPTVS